MKEFSVIKTELAMHIKEMLEGLVNVFQVELDRDELWNTYIEGFPEGTNEIYRERREHDCNCCRHFIRDLGKMVKINDDYSITTIWDFNSSCSDWQVVIDKMANAVKKSIVVAPYFSNFKKVGTDFNYELLDDNSTHKWEHFYYELPNVFVNKTGKTLGDIYGERKSIKDVFERGLQELTVDSFEIVLDLINQGSLYKGNESKAILNSFLELKKEYDNLSEKQRKNFAWVKAANLHTSVTKIRNTAIGTLLIDISNNVDLDNAVKSFEVKVAPQNYKRSTPVYSKKMLEDAKNKIIELGCENSLNRRFATIDDITMNNILFMNRDDAKQKDLDLFGEMEKDITVSEKNFSKVETVDVDKFVSEILPTVSSMEILVENKHRNNFVSLIAPKEECKSIFKWNNGFSWAYSGNVTDRIKENVAKAGGNVDGVLRCSLQWNDEGVHNKNDFDLHCVEPTKNEIMYSNMHSRTSGALDVDERTPKFNIPAVENIVYSNVKKMPTGVYKFFVKNFSYNQSPDGFKVEIEFGNQVFNFEYNKPLRGGETVKVADVVLQNGEFTLKEKLPSTTTSKKIWEIDTMKFVPVSSLMMSPNYWDGEKGSGNKHYFFMINGCVNPETPNAFYNEFLKEEFIPHRKVFEALGAKAKVEQSDKQLSGVGFSDTIRNEVVVKIKSTFERVIKIKF